MNGETYWEQVYGENAYEAFQERVRNSGISAARAAELKTNAVRDNIRELIEADREYDEAHAALNSRDPFSKKLSDVAAMVDRVNYATQRRAAALAAMSGVGDE